jgi:hypothetical protein
VLVEVFRRGWPEVSSSVPERVQNEVERYLHCGDVRYGFVEVSCSTCHEARLVALSCKGRGWCPSCTTRRALETGIELETRLPHVAYRQWTLSLPYQLRPTVVREPKYLKRLEVLLVRAVWAWQRKEARRQGVSSAVRGGAVCFWQWFGSSLQLTPHLHLLVPEALFEADGRAIALPAPDDEVVRRILERVLWRAKKWWVEHEGAAWADDEYEALQHQAMQQPLDLAQTLEAPAAHRARRVAVLEGFSLHADTWVHANDRKGLERLARYGARGPVSENRLKRLDDGRYEYTPKKGRTFTVTATALVRALVALVPPPKLHRTSFHGVFAPNSSMRATVTKAPPAPPPLQSTEAAVYKEEAEATSNRLGDAAPTDLRHRRHPLSMWRPPHHSRPARHPPGRRAAAPRTWSRLAVSRPVVAVVDRSASASTAVSCLVTPPLQLASTALHPSASS